MKYNSKSKVERDGGYRIRLKLQKGLVKAGWWLYKLKFHQDSTDKLHMLGDTHTHKKRQEYQQMIIQAGRCLH